MRIGKIVVVITSDYENWKNSSGYYKWLWELEK